MATKLYLSGVLYPDGTTRQTAAAYNFRQRAIFGYGLNSALSPQNITNTVSNTGAVATDTTGVGTARSMLGACGYGNDKAIFAFGFTNSNFDSNSSTRWSNLVSNTGVVAADVQTANANAGAIAGFTYGADKGMFTSGSGYTDNSSRVHLVSNLGVLTTSSSISQPYPYRYYHAGTSYGGDKAIQGFGSSPATFNNLNTTELITNTGSIGSTRTHSGYTAKYGLAAASYGVDKAIFGFGFGNSSYQTARVLISNTGDLMDETSTVGTARNNLAASSYGGDKAIFGYGRDASSHLTTTNLVSRIGVVIADSAGAGTARQGLAASGYGA